MGSCQGDSIVQGPESRKPRKLFAPVNREAIFSSSISKNVEVYAPKNSFMKPLLFILRIRE